MKNKRLIIYLIIVLIIFLITYSGTINDILSETFSTRAIDKEIICDENNKSCELEKEIHELVNIKRQENKLLTLIKDNKLSEIARAHSQDMIDREFMDHINPDALDVSDRGKLAGYECKKYHGLLVEVGLAENLYKTSIYNKETTLDDNENKLFELNSVESISRKIVTGWINSQGHKENLFNGNHTREGIGVAISNESEIYVTQVFC